MTWHPLKYSKHLTKPCEPGVSIIQIVLLPSTQMTRSVQMSSRCHLNLPTEANISSLNRFHYNETCHSGVRITTNGFSRLCFKLAESRPILLLSDPSKVWRTANLYFSIERFFRYLAFPLFSSLVSSFFTSPSANRSMSRFPAIRSEKIRHRRRSMSIENWFRRFLFYPTTDRISFLAWWIKAYVTITVCMQNRNWEEKYSRFNQRCKRRFLN